MKTFRNIVIFILVIGTVIALLPAGAFFAIHLIDKNYALRVNSFSAVEDTINDYYVLAGVITTKVQEGKVKKGDTLLIKDKQLYKVTDSEPVSLNVTTEQGLSLDRILKFSFSHNTVKIYDNMYHIVSGDPVDSLAYTIDGKEPDKQDPSDPNMVYYEPKKVDRHFYVLVRDPKPNANYFQEGFEIVEWMWSKVKTKFFSK